MKCKEECIKKNKSCSEKECRNWIDYRSDLNCVLICAEKHGALTLHETSKRIGVSYVRIKQIQDKALKKILSANGEIFSGEGS